MDIFGLWKCFSSRSKEKCLGEHRLWSRITFNFGLNLTSPSAGFVFLSICVSQHLCLASSSDNDSCLRWWVRELKNMTRSPPKIYFSNPSQPRLFPVPCCSYPPFSLQQLKLVSFGTRISLSTFYSALSVVLSNHRFEHVIHSKDQRIQKRTGSKLLLDKGPGEVCS